jgi:hypothetical protein
MAKRPKKTKTPRIKGGSTKGSAKALGISYSEIGAQVETDKVYDFNSDLIKKFKSVGYQVGSDTVDFVTEYEFNKNYIVQTIKSTSREPDISGDYDTVTRIVYQGEFAYSKGAVTNATINLMAQVFDSAMGGNIWRFPQAIRVNNPSSLASWASALNGRWPDEWATDGYSSEQFANDAYTSVMRMDGGKEIWETGGGKATFQSLGGGKFFYDGWESEPFASNLI